MSRETIKEWRVVGETSAGEKWDREPVDDYDVAARKADDLAEHDYNRRVEIESRTWEPSDWAVETEVKLGNDSHE